ncbi:MAG: putative Ig domain-containing protein, partial [Verrucomicrobiae bacterium]|nr:putative Ig domain-containing protein [Verrucomicrobiae bacterium]
MSPYRAEAQPYRVWGTYYGGSQDDYAHAIAVDPQNGSVYLCGFTVSTSPTGAIATPGTHQTTFGGGGADVFLVKINPVNGQRIWGTYFGGNGEENFYNYEAGYVAVGPDSGVYLTGYTGSSSGIATSGTHQTVYSGGIDAFLAKFNPSNGQRIWGTYYGGPSVERAYAVEIDMTNGHVYLAGFTQSATGIATTGTQQPTFGGNTDAFLARFNPTNGQLVWGTYYGQSAGDIGYAVAVDPNDGSVYLAGATNSASGIATTGAHQTTFNGGGDGFIAKFNPLNGIRIWGTYYGGNQDDRVFAAAVGNDSSLYIAGTTLSNWPSSSIGTTGTFQPNMLSSSYNGFVARINPTNGQRIWGTYYGGTVGSVFGESIFVGLDNSVYFGGYTNSTSPIIASTGAYQPSYGGGTWDAFLAKFNPTNGQRIWGTYYGGPQSEWIHSLTNDPTTNAAYIGGWTSSTSGIATPGTHQTAFNGGLFDAFIAKFSEVFINLSNVPSCGIVGQTINATVTAQTAAGCLPITLSAATLPSGLTFNAIPNSGTVSGTLSATGVHTLSITGTDSCSSTTTYSKIIHVGTPPTLPNYPTVYGMVGFAMNFNASGTVHPFFTPASYSISPPLPSALTLNPSTGFITGSPSNTSPLTNYTVTITDSCGHTATSILPLQVVPYQSCSAINLSATATAPNCSSIQINWAPNAFCGTGDFVAIRYRIGTNPWIDVPNASRPSVPTLSTTLTGLSPSTTYEVQIQTVFGQNTAPNPAAWITIGHIAVPACPSAPTITGPASVTHCNPGAVSITMTATNSPTSWAVVGSLPTGLSLNTGTGVISGNVAVGVYSFTVTASNAGGTSAPFTVNLTVNSQPSITSAGSLSATLGQTFTHVVTATGTPTPSVTVSAITPAPGLNISGDTILGTPTATGTFTYQATATNSCGTVSQTVTITVTHTPPPPVVLLTQARLRAMHGSFQGDVMLPLAGSVSGVDPRAHTVARELVLTFNVPVTSVSVVQDVGPAMTLGAPVYSGSTVRIPVSGLTNNAKYRVKLTSVNGQAVTGNDKVNWRIIRGDVNGNGTVNA